jgi:integrase
VSAKALEFAILTAARTSEVVGATWSEIDLRSGVWTIPAHRMKAGKEHRVPLSDRALEVLRSLPREGDFVFMGGRAGKPLSNMALLELMRGMKPGFVPHGFRSTFRDWAADLTPHSSEVVEMALAHALESKVEAAYRRSDLFEKRRRLMTDWASHCAGAARSGDVVPIRSGALA